MVVLDLHLQLPTIRVLEKMVVLEVELEVMILLLVEVVL